MAFLSFPSIDSNSLGHVVTAVARYDSTTGFVQIYTRLSTNNGDTWGSVTRASFVSFDCFNPTVTIDDKGTIVILFETIDNNFVRSIYQVYKLHDSSSYSTARRVDFISLTVGSNMVTNGGFENWTTGNPDNWIATGTPTKTQEATIIHSGVSSLKLTNSDSSNYVGQQITLDGALNDIYAIQVSMRAQTGSTANVRLSSTELFDTVLNTENESIWEYRTFAFRKPVVANVTLNIHCYGSSTGDTVFFDSISFYKLDSNKVASQHLPNAVIDSDFKKGHVNAIYTRPEMTGNEIRVLTATADGGVDISEDVVSLRISRDKEFKTGVFGAGDFDLVLDNHNGIYTNEKESSPFHKRLKSGLEVDLEIGVREFSGTYTDNIYDITNWTTEYFPVIKGICTKFEQDSARQTLTLSGRDRAELFMAYRNYTSEIFQNKQALELIQQLANEDLDGDGVGDYDDERPTINLTEDATQQTLTVWDEELISSLSAVGDAGSNVTTISAVNTIDFASNSLGVFLCAWLERTDTNKYIWALSWLSGSNIIYLSQWSSWTTTPVLENSWDVTSQFGTFATGIIPYIKSTVYDATNDCVWLLFTFKETTTFRPAPEYNISIRHFNFNTRVATLKYQVVATIGTTDPAVGRSSCIVLDQDNDKLWVCVNHGTSPPVGSYGLYSIDGSLNVTQDFFSSLYVGTTTSPNREHHFWLPTFGIKYNDYYYMGVGLKDYAFATSDPFFAAYSETKMHTSGSTNLFGSTRNTNPNTAICYIGTTNNGGYTSTWMSGEDFFGLNSNYQRGIASIDYDDAFVYMFVDDGSTSQYDHLGTGVMEIRYLASRKRTTFKTNLATQNHTIVNGYTEDDIDYIHFPDEVLKVENRTLLDGDTEYNHTEYTNGVFTLTGDQDITSGFPDIPVDDYHINLESGDVLLSHLFDKKNRFRISYDYKYSVPFAWFEDTSIWDAIQEVASAGDFVCYISESGELVFKDRFKYHYPVLSDHVDYLTTSNTWNTGGSNPYQIQDSSNNDIINIIPGLEFVTSINPDKDTGKFTQYRRRSYKTNGNAFIGNEGDYDIDYDTGEIAWHSGSDIETDQRVRIYYYNRDHLFNYSYDSNIYDLKYSWGSDTIANRVTVKGERYYPASSSINSREVYVVNPGDTILNTGFLSIKQLDVANTVTGVTQKQFDEYQNTWRSQTGSPIIDFEFRNKFIGDTVEGRAAGNAIRVRAIPCRVPGEWISGASAAGVIPDEEWVGQGFTINWSSMGDTGLVNQPTVATSEAKMNIKNIEILSNGLRIEVDHLERDDKQYYVQLEVIGYPLIRIFRFTALHEDFASIQKYYRRSYELDNKFISDMDTAKWRARFLVHQLSEEYPEVDIEVVGSPHVELEDVVSVVDTNSGLAGDYFEVIGISDSMSNDSYTTKLTLRKICEVSVSNLALGNRIAGYGGGYIGKIPLPTETFINTDFL